MLAKEISFIERFKARASHAAQVQSRVKKLEKIDRVEPPKRRQTVAFEFLPAPRSGDDVGVNGAGKPTLLKLVAGSATPDGGIVTVGSSVKMGYFAQHAMEVLEGDR